MAATRDPRRLPAQERSQATVDAILTAVEKLSAADGVENLKVSKIGKRAGVTLGTFYQYFPSLEAVVAAWEERELASDRNAVLVRIADHLEKRPPYEVIVRDLVELVFEIFARRRRYFKTPTGGDFLSRRIARLQLAEPVLDAMTSALQNAPDQRRLRGPNYRAMLHVVLKASWGIAHHVTFSALPDEEVAAIRAETVKMIIVYMIRDAVIAE